MRSTSQAHADAHEPVSVSALPSMPVSVLQVDGLTALYVHGSPAQRADFLRRLARAAETAADELVPRVETVGVPGLAAQR